MMIQAVIADDEPHLAQYLKDQLAQLWPELQVVHVAKNGLEAAAKIAELQPELAFLDIQMPGLTGLEVAQGIEGQTKVVFVTAFDEYAVQAFEQAAFDYVLKPIKTERLRQCIERLKQACASPTSEPVNHQLAQLLHQLMPQTMPQTGAAPRLRYVRASQGDFTHLIDVEEVHFFRADDKYTCVLSAKGEHLIRTPISELTAQLDPEQFWQIHRSTLINLRFLDGTRRDEASRLFVRMKGHAQELPVSRAYVHLFKAM